MLIMESLMRSSPSLSLQQCTLENTFPLSGSSTDTDESSVLETIESLWYRFKSALNKASENLYELFPQ